MSVKDIAGMKRLVRGLKSAGIETRETDSGGTKKRWISGFIPYKRASEDLGGFIEFVQPGAFSRTLKDNNIRALWAHNTQYVLGNSRAGTLTFEDREDGLHFDIEVPNTSWANDLFETVSRRDAPGVSFGFDVISDQWTDLDKDCAKRDLLEVRLYEVSVGVAFPAYPDSDSGGSMRALGLKNGIDFEQIASALTRAKDTGKVQERDIDLFKRTVDALNRMLPDESRQDDEGKPQECVSKEPPEGVLARLRELEMMEAEQSAL